jgi:hypothetical protein
MNSVKHNNIQIKLLLINKTKCLILIPKLLKIDLMQRGRRVLFNDVCTYVCICMSVLVKIVLNINLEIDCIIK